FLVSMYGFSSHRGTARPALACFPARRSSDLAPSPSETMASARVRATCSTASSNVFHSAPSRDGSTPDAPPASSRTVSFVLVSPRSEEHTSELQSRGHLVCRLLLEKEKSDRKS